MDAEGRQEQFQFQFLEVLFTSSTAEEALSRLRSEPGLAQTFENYELSAAMLALAVQTFQYHARATGQSPAKTGQTL